MGCFDVACGISNLTIKHGDKAVLLFLLPYSEYHRFDGEREIKLHPTQMQVFNEGPLGWYMPAFLPIRGTYNDYGSLENIEMDDAAKCLEAFMECKIEDLISIIHNGHYGHMQDSEMLKAYGKEGITADRYSSTLLDQAWLETLGFVYDKKKKRFNHPEVPEAYTHNGNKLKNLKFPRCYVTIEYSDFRKKDCAVIHYMDKAGTEWKKHENIASQNDFVKYFVEPSTGSRDKGVYLALDKDKINKAQYAFRMSGMFIDAKIYDAMTQKVKTKESILDRYMDNESILDRYMDKYLMNKIGFDFVETTGLEDKYQRDTKHWYTHKSAPGFKFSVNESHAMSTDMFKVVESMDDNNNVITTLKEIKTYNGKRSYHPFSPKGLAEMFKGETGNVLDLSGLDGYTEIDYRWEKIEDLLKGNVIKLKKEEELHARINNSNVSEADKAALKKDLMDLIIYTDRESDLRKRKEAMSYIAVPFVLDIYEQVMQNPTEEFKTKCEAFNRLIVSLWGINRQLMPSAHFCQHGEYTDQVAFQKIVLDVAKRKQKSRNKEYC